jgi:hypothetical protein
VQHTSTTTNTNTNKNEIDNSLAGRNKNRLTKYSEPKKNWQKAVQRMAQGSFKGRSKSTKIGCPQDDSRRLKRQTKGQVNGCLTTDQRTNTSTAELTFTCQG